MTAHSSHTHAIDQHYRRLYTEQAPHYDRDRFHHSKGQTFNTIEQRVIYQLLGLPSGQRLLDVAAGTGRIAVYLASQGLNVTGLDLTRSMLQQAQQRAMAHEVSQVRFVESNGRVLPFANDQFDAVISIRFLHLFPAALHRPFIQEMWRVLRPGGVLLVQFDSALAGGVVTYGREVYRQMIRRHKPRYYVWPQQIARSFAGIGPLTIHGFSPIGARAIRARYPHIAQTMERIVASGSRSYLANRVFVRAVKPGAAATIVEARPQ